MTAARSRHSLELRDRGTQHIHRWLPVCSCGGWVGIPLRDRGRAAGEYRSHVKAAEREAAQATRRQIVRAKGGHRLRRSRQPAGPKALTPWADLPPELQ